jgi:hypothetical protein
MKKPVSEHWVFGKKLGNKMESGEIQFCWKEEAE